MHSGFVPLRIFSCYTMLEGAIEPKAIAKQRARARLSRRRADRPQRALRRDGLFATPRKKAGVQPIIGTMLGVARPDMPEGVAAPIDWLALYAQDEAGYDNLCALVVDGASRPADRDGRRMSTSTRSRAAPTA